MIPQDLTAIFMVVCRRCGKREIGYKKSFVYDLEKMGWISEKNNNQRNSICPKCKLT